MATETYSPRDDLVLREFLSRVREAVGKAPQEVLLFGSRARGDHDPTSDYDLIMVYDEVTDEMQETIRRVESQVGMDHTVLISYWLVGQDELEGFTCEPFVINACREGVYI